MTPDTFADSPEALREMVSASIELVRRLVLQDTRAFAAQDRAELLELADTMERRLARAQTSRHLRLAWTA